MFLFGKVKIDDPVTAAWEFYKFTGAVMYWSVNH